MALTVATSVVAISLQSWIRVVGLLYMGSGVVAAPVALFLGVACTDSSGCFDRKHDFQCEWCFWCWALFPVTLVLGGCLLCFQVNQVLVYLLPALSPLLLACGPLVIDLTVGDTRHPEHASPVTDPSGVSLV